MATKTEVLYENIAKELSGRHGAVSTKMFGMPTLKINGKAFAGLINNAMTFKLTGEAHKKALGLKGAKLFEPMAGRPMKEWVQVPVAHSAEWKKFAAKALTYVSTKK